MEEDAVVAYLGRLADNQSGPVVNEIRQATYALARELKVVGLMNVQYAIQREQGRPKLYVLEVNPRASRTVPFVSKATGMPLAKVAAKVMVGVSLARQGYHEEPIPSHVSVKEAVFPFVKFAGVDVVLGPEMKSTGEVMGVSERFSIAFAKSQLAAGAILPEAGKVFVSVADRDKWHIVGLAGRLRNLGFALLATNGTARLLGEAGVPTGTVGDCYDRYRVRVEEMRQSLRIIEQARQQLPGGEVRSKVPHLIRPPAGEAYARIEAPKGELGFYLVSDNSIAPYRWHVRPTSLINLTALREMVRGWKVADLIVIFGSIDITMGEVDR